MIIGDGVILGGGGGESATIVVNAPAGATLTYTFCGVTKPVQSTSKPNPSYRNLPSGYTQLDYIESNGNQYINTEYTASDGTKVIADIHTLSNVATTQCLFGSIQNNAARYNVGIDASAKFEYQYGNDYGVSTAAVAANTDYNLEAVWAVNAGYLKVNGVTAQNRNGNSTAASYNMYLFARNNGGTVDRKATVRMSAVKIYSRDTLERDYVPCRNSSNSVGLYDVKNGTFNAGTGGTFTAGGVTPSTFDGNFVRANKYGTYTITSVSGGQTATKTVVVDAATTYEVTI